MSGIVRHPNRHIDSRSAAVSALIRWFPSSTVLSLAILRTKFPNYPLISGGSPKPINSGSPDDRGGCARARA